MSKGTLSVVDAPAPVLVDDVVVDGGLMPTDAEVEAAVAAAEGAELVAAAQTVTETVQAVSRGDLQAVGMKAMAHLASTDPELLSSVMGMATTGNVDMLTLLKVGKALEGVVDPTMMAQMMGVMNAMKGAPAGAGGPAMAPRAAAPAGPMGGGGMFSGHPLALGPRIDANGNNIEAPPAPARPAAPAPRQAPQPQPQPQASGVRPTGRGRAQRQQEAEKQPETMSEYFDLLGRELAETFGNDLTGVALGIELNPEDGTWRVGTWIPGDEEDPNEEPLSEVTAPHTQLGAALAHVFAESAELLAGEAAEGGR